MEFKFFFGPTAYMIDQQFSDLTTWEGPEFRNFNLSNNGKIHRVSEAELRAELERSFQAARRATDPSAETSFETGDLTKEAEQTLFYTTTANALDSFKRHHPDLEIDSLPAEDFILSKVKQYACLLVDVRYNDQHGTQLVGAIVHSQLQHWRQRPLDEIKSMAGRIFWQGFARRLLLEESWGYLGDQDYNLPFDPVPVTQVAQLTSENDSGESLQELVLRTNPKRGSSRPTIATLDEIADLAGVSRGVVKRAKAGKKIIRTAEEAVRTVCEKLLKEGPRRPRGGPDGGPTIPQNRTR